MKSSIYRNIERVVMFVRITIQLYCIPLAVQRDKRLSLHGVFAMLQTRMSQMSTTEDNTTFLISTSCPTTRSSRYLNYYNPLSRPLISDLLTPAIYFTLSLPLGHLDENRREDTYIMSKMIQTCVHVLCFDVQNHYWNDALLQNLQMVS